MSLFKDKTLMITGGTGSFGNVVLNRFLNTDIGEIRVFSRDEKKQDDMRHEFQVKMPEVADKIKFYIGDVRDLQSIRSAMHDVDYIFHAAALKQVPSCEFFPIEAVKTNVLGTENVLTAAIEANLGFASVLLDTLKKHKNNCPVMLSSSIQATLIGRYGDSDYGKSKLAGENLFFDYAKETGAKVLVYRFPNLFGKWCRPNYNSAVATFCNNIANGLEVTVNDRNTELELLYIDDLVEEC